MFDEARPIPRGVSAVTLAMSVSVLIGGCATARLTSTQQDRQAKEFVAPPGRSLVYIYRGNSVFGAAVLMQVTFDSSLGVIGPNNFLMQAVEPGSHVVLLEMGGRTPPIPSRVTFDAKAGEKYYIFTSLEMANLTTNRIDQKFVPPQTAEKDLARFHRVEWIAETITPSGASGKFPGTSMADAVLQRDAAQSVVIYAAVGPACKERKVVNTEISELPKQPGKDPWAEKWTVDRCGTLVDYKVSFKPSPSGGTQVIVSPWP